MADKKFNLKCRCGQVSITAFEEPIISAECLCSDCQKAGAILQKRDGAPQILDVNGATKFVLYRKDKIEFHFGHEKLKSHYLENDSKTRRVVASCCNTPMFLEFNNGHWLSVYGLLWPEASLPQLEIRTMTRSRPEGVVLPKDVPNPESHNFSFYVKLFGAWFSMRFHTPKIDFIAGTLDD